VDDAENKAICIVLAVVVRRVLSLLSFLWKSSPNEYPWEGYVRPTAHIFILRYCWVDFDCIWC